MRRRGSVLTTFLVGVILFVMGAARLWGEAGVEMSLGFIFIALALAVRGLAGSWSPPAPALRKTMIERSKRDKQIAEAVKVGDHIELHSFIQPPIQWESVEVIAILPQARAGYVTVQVRHADGTESTQSLQQLWHPHPLSRMWRPLASERTES